MTKTPLILEPGIYTNVFPVSLPDAPLQTMTAGRDKFPDLRSLREEFERGGGNVRLFADRESVYAYDADAQTLETRGFRPKEIDLSRRPDFAKRLIVEGITAAVALDGYEKRDRIGRLTIYQAKPRASVTGGRLRLHLGYDLRALYWRYEPDEAWNFGLIVDVRWSIRDDTGPVSLEARYLLPQ